MGINVITEMEMLDWQILPIVRDFRRMLKLEEVFNDYDGYPPLYNMRCFVENAFPAIRKTMVSGDIGEEYDKLQKYIVSDASDEEVMEVLLGRKELKNSDGL